MYEAECGVKGAEAFWAKYDSKDSADEGVFAARSDSGEGGEEFAFCTIIEKVGFV